MLSIDLVMGVRDICTGTHCAGWIHEQDRFTCGMSTSFILHRRRERRKRDSTAGHAYTETGLNPHD